MVNPLTPVRAIGSYFRDLWVSLWSIFEGMAVTIKVFFTKPVTQQYPHEMKELPERSRGTLVLYANPETLKCKCTVCLLCELVCPNNSIHMDFKRDSENNKKILTKYIWDSDKCIHCGLCVEACNFKSLGWTPDFEHSTGNKKKLTWNERDMLNAWIKHDQLDIDAKKIKLKWY